MKKILIFLGAIILTMMIFVGWFFSQKNALITASEDVNAAWAQVENVYQRRADLVPNLVNTVKGYAAHESETLKAVVEARSQVGQINAGIPTTAPSSPEDMARFEQAQNNLGGALSRLLVVAERYPDLKAGENFLALQSQLEGTENRIAVERRRYNEVVRTYNIRVQSFPSSFIAALSGFEKKVFFQAQPGSEKAPKVEF